MTGCDQLSFNPSLYAQPTTERDRHRLGHRRQPQVPQQQSPTIPRRPSCAGRPSPCRRASRSTPTPPTARPPAPTPKRTSAPSRPPNCPEFSKVGSLEIDSSALPGPAAGLRLPRRAAARQPLPDLPRRRRLRHPHQAAPARSRRTRRRAADDHFTNLPQSPLTAFNMHFFGSERGSWRRRPSAAPTRSPRPSRPGTRASARRPRPSSSPSTPGRAGPHARVPSGPSARASKRPRPATPPAPTAPSRSNCKRTDGDQNLTGARRSRRRRASRATLAGIPYCPEAALARPRLRATPASPSWPTRSARPRRRSAPRSPAPAPATTRSTSPARSTSPVPTRARRSSLAVVTPAVSGPYDLGNVVVRAALHVDPTDAQITAVSDPLPQILEGIPLRLRSIQVNLDRPDFTLNPTNCDPFAVGATIFGDRRRRWRAAAHRFQVANCATLPFAPKLALSSRAASNRPRPPGDPRDPDRRARGSEHRQHRRSRCRRASSSTTPTSATSAPESQFAAENCPAELGDRHRGSDTPLLDKPLEGHGLPALGSEPRTARRGRGPQRADRDRPRRQSRHASTKRLRTTFETVPDAPVSKFVLNLMAAAKGLLSNSAEPLRGRRSTRIEKMAGQNGVVAERQAAAAADLLRGREGTTQASRRRGAR